MRMEISSYSQSWATNCHCPIWRDGEQGDAFHFLNIAKQYSFSSLFITGFYNKCWQVPGLTLEGVWNPEKTVTRLWVKFLTAAKHGFWKSTARSGPSFALFLPFLCQMAFYYTTGPLSTVSDLQYLPPGKPASEYHFHLRLKYHSEYRCLKGISNLALNGFVSC